MNQRRNIPTLSSLEEAMAVGQPILEDFIQKLKNAPKHIPQGPLVNPWHIEKGKTPWEMSIPALKNTLQYIMNDLNHPCYMFCRAWNGKTQFYKLETKKTAARVHWAIQHLFKKKDDPDITKKRKQLMQQLKGDTMPYRIMQCIVKPFSNQFSWEYESWTHSWPLPPGVYILNLTDATLLRKDFRDPFLYSFLPEDNAVSAKEPFVPILSLSGHVDYWDIPIPTYDDMMYTFPQSKEHQAMKARVAEFTTEWFEKTKDTIVFRGSSSGCGVSPETNTRMRLMKYASQTQANFLDVGFTAGKKGKMLLDPIQGFVLTREPATLVGFKSMAEQSQHKYILHVDGNVLAYRLLYSLLTGSVLFRVKSPYLSFVDVTHLLKPGIHYIEIKEDLSDLESKWKWCQDHPKKAQEIARLGRHAAMEILTPEFLRLYVHHLFELYAEHQRVLQGGKRKNRYPIRTTRSTKKRRLSS